MMKMLVALAVLSLLALPVAAAPAAGPACAASNAPSAPNQAESPPAWAVEAGLIGDPGQCQVADRCESHLECEIACGNACGPLYGGHCLGLNFPVTQCECVLVSPF